MSVSRVVLMSAKVAAVAGAVFIAVTAPTIGAALSVADEGSTNQTRSLDDGNPWND